MKNSYPKKDNPLIKECQSRLRGNAKAYDQRTEIEARREWVG